MSLKNMDVNNENNIIFMHNENNIRKCERCPMKGTPLCEELCTVHTLTQTSKDILNAELFGEYNFDISYDGHPVQIKSAIGADDGWYWDYTIWFEYQCQEYAIIYVGTQGCQFPDMYAIKRGEFSRLFGKDAVFTATLEEEKIKEMVTYLLEKIGDSDYYEESDY